MKNIKLWWLLTLAGGTLLAIGIFCLVSPLNAYIFLVHYAGLTLLLNGILLIIVSYTSTGNVKEKKWLLVESVLDILFAVCLLFNPFMSFIAFPFLIGPWMIGKGFLKTLAALKLRQIHGLIFIFIAGFLSIVFGLLVMYYPLKRAYGITIFLGSFALVMGCLYVFDSIRYKNLPDTINLML
jgi:uncharacterized membrane protein HdeD (DUF308 family)